MPTRSAPVAAYVPSLFLIGMQRIAILERPLCQPRRAGARCAGVVRRPVVLKARCAGVVRRPVMRIARCAGVVRRPVVLEARCAERDRMLGVVPIDARYVACDSRCAWFRARPVVQA